MLQFQPLRGDLLDLVDCWFDDQQTRRWLGGRGWAAASMALADPPNGRHVLGAFRDSTLVGMLDVECTPDGSASFALVVDPQCRREGLGKQMIRTMLHHPLFARVTRFWCGVEDGNVASARLTLSCGFVPVSMSSESGFVDYELAVSRPHS
jgi:RimJ/RimL family protein N-acetyltransferase